MEKQERLILNNTYVIVSDEMSILPPELSFRRLMQTDPTERDTVLPSYDDGFTQTWDTVGAGKNPMPERARLRGA
ncbi:MAG: hypothetical protein ACOC6G_01340 [Thermoproteota archaeon]